MDWGPGENLESERKKALQSVVTLPQSPSFTSSITKKLGTPELNFVWQGDCEKAQLSPYLDRSPGWYMLIRSSDWHLSYGSKSGQGNEFLPDLEF